MTPARAIARAGKETPAVNTRELMQRYLEGDHRAFTELYAQVAPRLLTYLRRLVGDAAAAEDILQQTFAKLHAARASYRAGADPEPWIYAIARRTSIDELRRRRRARVRLERHGEALPDLMADLSGTAFGAEEHVPYGTEAPTHVLLALDTLPDDQRRAVILTKLEGKSVAEAASILGTTAGAVKLRAHRAYGKLREHLRETMDVQVAPY
jgi:RNA polymerase sigma-70 factor (ECF subfamily)